MPAPKTKKSETALLISDHYTIKMDGKDKEIFMSFGLLRDLARALPNHNDPMLVFQDPNMFDTVLWLLLIDRSETGKILIDEFDLDDHILDEEAMVPMVKWAMEHLLSFFLRKLSQLPTLGEASLPQMEALLSAFPGLKASVSKSAFVGATASSEAQSENSTSVSPEAI